MGSSSVARPENPWGVIHVKYHNPGHHRSLKPRRVTGKNIALLYDGEKHDVVELI